MLIAYHIKICRILVAGMLVMLPLTAQDIIVHLDDIYPEETESAGFVLDSEQDISIEAVGAHFRGRYEMASNAWILNADTREVVWELDQANSRWKSRDLRDYSDTVHLLPGRYEVYYSSFPPHDYHDSWSFSKFFFGRESRNSYADAHRDFEITVRANGKAMNEKEMESIRNSIREKAVVALLTQRDDQYLHQGFQLDRDMDLVVYCLGELRDDGAYDYGWIINSDTRQRVWQISYRHSDDAGGVRKNRVARNTISLPAGNYTAFFVTDDSHAPRGWNSAPPFDAAFYGLSVYPANESEKQFVTLFDYEQAVPKNVFVDFSRMRDDDVQSEGFTLRADAEIHITAIGEGSDGDMYDYGWIINGRTHQRVWEMDYHLTEHAGGADKNRIFDDVIELKKGDYIAYFITDDSHSYRNWNSAPPFDQEQWGMTLRGAAENFDPKIVAEYDPEESNNFIARIVRVRDHATKKTNFEIKKDGEFRIYAIGEGMDGKMYDYAWLEEARTGRVVWEMTYRKTDHAGGARKNRMANELVNLKKGDYILYYESDDSHSFNHWNASPPQDPVNWGVTVFEDK